MWNFITDNILQLIIIIMLISISGIIYEMEKAQKKIKKTLELILRDPKNIVVEDMKILTGSFGFDEKENEKLKKYRKWKIIGIVSIFLNALFFFLIILGLI